MGKQGFKKLIVWYTGLSDLGWRRVAKERDTDRESVRFFYIAKGSLAELRTQLQIAMETGQVETLTYERVETECVTLGKMIGSLIQARAKTSRLVPRTPRLIVNDRRPSQGEPKP